MKSRLELSTIGSCGLEDPRLCPGQALQDSLGHLLSHGCSGHGVAPQLSRLPICTVALTADLRSRQSIHWTPVGEDRGVIDRCVTYVYRSRSSKLAARDAEPLRRHACAGAAQLT